MSAKHTPGPWTIRDRMTSIEIDAPDLHTLLHDDGSRPSIATVWVQPCTVIDGRVPRIDGDSRANANLIAAAPELLAALTAAEAWAPHGETCTDNECRCWHRYAHAAIAKAQGGKL